MSVLPEAKFQFLMRDVKTRTGLVMGPEKAYLLNSRLLPLARKEGFSSIEALVDAVMGGSKRLSIEIGEALATHETFFFRDKTPFTLLENIIAPALLKKFNGRCLKVWCAAASSGQEPYSIAMMVNEGRIQRCEILATDMSLSVLSKAKAGLFSQFEVQRGLPIKSLLQHFTQVGEAWKVRPSLRDRICFKQANLLSDFKTLGQHDVIFCRNVLLYFDTKTKTSVLDRLAEQLNDDGYLLLGAAETVVGLTTKLAAVPGHRGLFAKPCSIARMKAA